MGEILCQAFSPFEPNILLVRLSPFLTIQAGLSSGAVSLHRMHEAASLVVLVPPQSSRKAVAHVQWSPAFVEMLLEGACRIRTVFYSLHSNGRLLTWDLTVGRGPAAICDLSREISSRFGRRGREKNQSDLHLLLAGQQTARERLNRRDCLFCEFPRKRLKCDIGSGSDRRRGAGARVGASKAS